ncbi:iron-sulfur cluster insertion protein ErpA [Buchnera aphidicola (Kurisakia onigurumii)]|uniref:iron-sulfur cluster insertion protein ErpA n=1 Tax=Buchnera aphidicola TaxID=9 RepID=UPI0031B6E25D
MIKKTHKKKIIKLSNTSLLKITKEIKKKNVKHYFRIYIIGGGCNGFQYEFMLDKKYKKNDIIIQYPEIEIITDPISLQYLIGSRIEYIKKLTGSKFIVNNPNAKNTCGCGISFSI